jgi:hypothetical protein
VRFRVYISSRRWIGETNKVWATYGRILKYARNQNF